MNIQSLSGFMRSVLLTMFFVICRAAYMAEPEVFSHPDQVSKPETAEQRNEFIDRYRETEAKLKERFLDESLRVVDPKDKIENLQQQLQDASPDAQKSIEENITALQKVQAYKKAQGIVENDPQLQEQIKETQEKLTKGLEPAVAQEKQKLSTMQRLGKTMQTWMHQIELHVNRLFDWQEREKAVREKLDTLYEDLERYLDKARNKKQLALLQERDVERIKQHRDALKDYEKHIQQVGGPIPGDIANEIDKTAQDLIIAFEKLEPSQAQEIDPIDPPEKIEKEIKETLGQVGVPSGIQEALLQTARIDQKKLIEKKINTIAETSREQSSLLDQPKVLEQRIRDLQWLAQENVAAFEPRERKDFFNSLDLAKEAIDREFEKKMGNASYSVQQRIDFADRYFEFLDAYLPVQAKLDPALLTRAESGEKSTKLRLDQIDTMIDQELAKRLNELDSPTVQSNVINHAKSIFDAIKRHQPSQKLQEAQNAFINQLKNVLGNMLDNMHEIDIKNMIEKYSQEQSEEYAEQQVQTMYQNVNDLIALMRDAKTDAARVKASLKTSR